MNTSESRYTILEYVFLCTIVISIFITGLNVTCKWGKAKYLLYTFKANREGVTKCSDLKKK